MSLSRRSFQSRATVRGSVLLEALGAVTALTVLASGHYSAIVTSDRSTVERVPVERGRTGGRDLRNTAVAARGARSPAAVSWYGQSWVKPSGNARAVAETHDSAFMRCTDDACRLFTASLAQTAEPTPARASRVEAQRAQLLEKLSFKHLPDIDLLLRLRAARAALTLARRTQDLFANDVQLVRVAAEARSRAEAELSTVPLIGSKTELISELLGRAVETDGDVAAVSLGNTMVYVVFDATKRCRGVYVVGATPGARTIPQHGEWSASRIISLVLGRSAQLKRPDTDATTVTRTLAGEISIVARWNNRQLAELRIGEAEP